VHAAGSNCVLGFVGGEVTSVLGFENECAWF